MKSFGLTAIRSILLLLMAGCSIQGGTEIGPIDPQSDSTDLLTFKGAANKKYRAKLYQPESEISNGWGVLMIGGGYGNDLNWTTPGTIRIDGKEHQMTLTGDSHQDAPRIAHDLVSRGFTVVHYSTIAVEDPLHDQWPQKMAARKLSTLTHDAICAKKTLEKIGKIESNKVILLGHSLGATRACTIAAGDQNIAGLILLAPAYFGNTSELLEANNLISGRKLYSRRNIPCLAIFGANDTSPAVDFDACKQLEAIYDVDIRIFEGLGHNLGYDRADQTGPIQGSVTGFIADWAQRLIMKFPD